MEAQPLYFHSKTRRAGQYGTSVHKNIANEEYTIDLLLIPIVGTLNASIHVKTGITDVLLIVHHIAFICSL